MKVCWYFKQYIISTVSCTIEYTTFAVNRKVGTIETRFNLISWMTVVTPTDRPIVVLSTVYWRFCVVHWFFEFSVGKGVFVIGLIQISFFFSFSWAMKSHMDLLKFEFLLSLLLLFSLHSTHLVTRANHSVAITWVDQKVLKLVAYLLKYMTELYQTYTEYATTISWFGSVVRMTQYARGYMTSSFDDVMQQWPGVKNVRNCLFPAKCNHQHLCFIWQFFFFRGYNGLDVVS